MPFCQEVTVVPVSLDIGKSSFCLDAAVDTQLNAMFARDVRYLCQQFLRTGGNMLRPETFTPIAKDF